MSALLWPGRGTIAFTQTDESFAAASGEAATPSFPGLAKAEPQAWDQLIDELLRIRHLEDDWDGEGTEAPHPALVDGAIALAQCLQAMGKQPADRIHAGVNGTVYFEWHMPLGYLEIEITSPVDAEGRWVRTGADQAEVFRLSRRS